MTHEPTEPDGFWTVYRQDDNGNRFIIRAGISRVEASRIVNDFESRGHKQLYWMEPHRPSDHHEDPVFERIERDPVFLSRIEAARRQIREGRGVRLEDVKD